MVKQVLDMGLIFAWSVRMNENLCSADDDVLLLLTRPTPGSVSEITV